MLLLTGGLGSAGQAHPVEAHLLPVHPSTHVYKAGPCADWTAPDTVDASGHQHVCQVCLNWA